MSTKKPASGPGGPAEEGEITRRLAELRAGDEEAFERLVPLLYDDLRRIASQRLRRERAEHTLGTTALVHEAYLRLITQRKLVPADRGAFLAAASNVMRRVLVDYARTRKREKRGGDAEKLPFEAVAPFLGDRAAEEMLVLDDALRRLAAAHPRAARVFEQRAFGGLLVEELAELHGVSGKTIKRDWAAARAWLRKEVLLELDVPDEAAASPK